MYNGLKQRYPLEDRNLELAREQIRSAGKAASRLVVRSFFDERTFTASHVAYDPTARHAAIVDSVLDFDPDSGRTFTRSAEAIVNFVEKEKLAVDYHLETHAHADHLSATPFLQRELGGKICIGREIVTVQTVFGQLFNLGSEFARDGSQFDQLIPDGERFSLAEIPAIVLHVPGHTPADVAYVIGDAAFIGDTLFMPDYGTARADFPAGDARQLYRSIRRLLSLPGETRLFLCHD